MKAKLVKDSLYEYYQNVELTPEEVEGAESIESDDMFSRRYRLKDGRVIDVSPDGSVKFIQNPHQEENEENEEQIQHEVSNKESFLDIIKRASEEPKDPESLQQIETTKKYIPGKTKDEIINAINNEFTDEKIKGALMSLLGLFMRGDIELFIAKNDLIVFKIKNKNSKLINAFSITPNMRTSEMFDVFEIPFGMIDLEKDFEDIGNRIIFHILPNNSIKSRTKNISDDYVKNLLNARTL
jgi:hypothetical protein